MRKKLILIVFFVATLFCSAAPKLTVFILVDGLDMRSMQEMQPLWSRGGLRTLTEEAYQTSVVFPQLVYGGEETTTTILTGLTPFYHNYQSDYYFHRSNRKPQLILADEKQTGIHSRETLSPAALTCSMLADKHRLNESTQAKIYAIGVNPLTTILLAGHAANACCWIENNGWGSTTYYTEGLPSAADRMNSQGGFNEVVKRTWTNRMDITSYLRPTALEKKKNGFSYDSSKNLRHSPAANTLVVNLVLEMQQAEKLGQRGQHDLLLLNMTVLSPKTNTARITSAEQEDMYIRLNQDLGFLMEQLSQRISKTDLQIILVGKPCYGYNPQDLQAAGLNTLTFNIDRAAALVGTYLMAMYGHERWVDGGYGNSIFLNRTLIEQKKLSVNTIRRQVADILEEMEGVHKAFPISELPLLQGDGEMAKLRNSTGRYAGDVVVMLTEGTTLMQGEKLKLDNVLTEEPVVPLLFWCGAYLTFPDMPTPLPATDIIKLIIK